MKIPLPYFLSPLFIFLFILFACENLYAKWATTAPLSRVHQVDGPVDASDLNQKILKIVMSSSAPLGTSTITALNFNLTGNNEISTIKIVYTSAANDSNFTNATNQFGGIITNPGASISFSGSYTAPTANGLFFFWLVCDAKAAIANGVVIDATLTSFTGGSVPAWENSAPPINPTGFRLTGRNYTIGTGESYPTIRETANGISRFDYDGTDNIFMELTANYANPAESGSSISFLNHTGPANIIIRPQTGQTGKITGGDPGSAVAFMGFQKAQKIILDGRPGGIDPANPDNRWTIRNTRTAATVGSALYFSDDADFNTIKYLNIEGEVAPAQSGIVLINTSVAATGNDNISFNNCIIRDWAGSTALPYGGIVSIGTAGKPNTNITIDSCWFVNIFNPASLGSTCINVNTNSDLFTITNNHFFQTAGYSALNNDFFVIDVSTGSGHTVTGNFIGGTGINCSGTPLTVTSGTAALIGMRFNTTGTPPVIENNTVANINYTTASTAFSYKIIGILSQGTANYTIGSSGKGNTIGSMTTTGNISLTNTASGSYGFAGIRNSSTGTVNIAYNKIGGITVGASGGINNNQSLMISRTAGTVTIDNNIIGGTVANSITQSSNAALYAINNSDAGGMTVTNNTIQNFNHSGGTGTDCNGIVNGDGALTATGNTIKNFTLYSNVNNYSIYHGPATSATATINNNIIQDISSTNTGTAASWFGILIQTGSAVTCNGNTIGSAINNNISIAGDAPSYGIYNTGGGALTANNNTIQEIISTSALSSARLVGIFNASGTGTIAADGNTIKNLDCAASNLTYPLAGIQNASASGGNFITKNTIRNLNLTNTSAVNISAAGIYTQSGTGTAARNFITEITNQALGATATIYGCISNSSWNFYNNVVILANSTSLGYVDGIDVSGTGNVNMYHNTIKLYGTATGGTGGACSYLTTSGIKNIKNNIFQNLRTGPGTYYYAVQLGNTGALTVNNNYLEVANNQNQLCYYTSDNTFAQWKTNTGATNDLNGTITLDSIGKVVTTPFPGAGTGANLTATVAEDKLDVTRGIASWMGAYEGQNITASAISPLAYCAGGAIGVSYTVGGSGSFNGGNIFTAQLSNTAGDFSSPTNIGTLASTTSGTIAATIPGSTPAGTGYRIRVVSSNPQITGSGNGADINIQTAAPSAPTATAATVVTCSGFTANWTASAGAASYLLSVATDAGFISIVTGYNNLDVGNVTSYAVTGLVAATTYYYRLKATNGCGISAVSNTISQLTSGAGQGTYVVTSTANTGAGTLRQAITDANANCGHDIIRFNLGAALPYTITLSAALPNLTDNDGVTIDGWDNTLNDGTPNSIPVFNATTATPMNPIYAIILVNSGTVATGLVLASNNNIIKGLVLQDFGGGSVLPSDIAITISGNNNQILGCYIGMDATGITRGTKTAIGISVSGENNQIGDGTATGANLISGMNAANYGVQITGVSATGNKIKGNMIGLQKDGSTMVAGAQQGTGVRITTSSASNIIGGSIAGEGNVISGQQNGFSTAIGIDIFATAGPGNIILGNIIGTMANGSTYVTSNGQGTGISISTANNIIGGNTAGARNIISGNEISGVYITGVSSTGNVVKGNYIGIDKNGTTFITGSAQDYGVYITSSAASNTIGGSVLDEGNVISGNTSQGIFIASSAVAGNSIIGNIIGLQANGTSYVTSNVQTYGINISGSPNNTIGGNTAGARNIISGNVIPGIYITGAGSTGNVVKGNYIGIDKTGTTFITGSAQDYGVWITSSAASNTIGGSGAGEGNVISGNMDGTSSGRGIYINSTATAGNTVLGNIIGPQADGVTYLASNGQFRGIEINGSPNNTIGGNTAGARNIISANETYGVYITGASSTGNVVKGNYIGIAQNGTTFITGSTQNIGVFVGSTAGGDHTIGGSGTGDGNVISGSNDGVGTGVGIYIESPAVAGNSVLGNIIGPQADGLTYLASNAQSRGIIISESPNNIIGGNTAGARNIISGNETTGIQIQLTGAVGNAVKGNYIGIDKTGTSFITGSSQDNGVSISVAGNTIGGNVAGEGNVISGNKDGLSTGKGIYLWSSGATGTTIFGNIIGPQADGMGYVVSSAQVYGIVILDSPNNIIGGTTAGARNIISANETYGVAITGAGSTGNVVKGNYIGIAQNGTTFITGNTQDCGVYITTSAASNTIGGSGSGEGNVISGNKDAFSSGKGIYITSSAAAGNTVLGNIIGPQADGVTYLTANGQFRGVEINGSPNNTIGGNTVGSRNIISANETYGVFITGASSTGNVVKGNYIGIDKNGTTFISGSTQDYGVAITSSAASNTIGGNVAGEGNVISGNTLYGIFTNSSAASGNAVQGNIIGPQADGISYVVSNIQTYGLYVWDSPNNTIGGNTAGARNIISANESYGVYITGAGSTGNIIKGNYIGIDKNGTTFITGSTQDYGVLFAISAASNTIGGSGAGEGNVISGNKLSAANGFGIYLVSAAAAGNTVLGNIIGPQADGVTYLASNAQYRGIEINGSPNNTIGGNTAGARNIISANENYGVYITGAASSGNVVKGNYLGASTSLSNITGSNQDYGVFINTSADTNTIGGSLAGEANQIAFNTVNGVYLIDVATTSNLISRNPIYNNIGKPINLNYGASQGNNGKTKPTIITATPTTVSGTSGAGDIIEIFKNTTGICTDASSFVGSTTADGAGNWSLVVALASCDYVLATATDVANNTSEFSECYLVTGTIATAAIVPTSLCAGVSLNISYSIPCNYNPGNIFTAQLSDAAGSFVFPTTIGTLISQTAGAISAEIPSATPVGTGYRIRVISSNPPVNGSDNGANLTISVCSRYWVNGAGNWNDPGNWSETSGGLAGASAPHKGVYVYLDANSFTGPGQIVTLPAGVWYMKSFIPSGVGQQAVIIGQGSMVVGQ